MIARDRIPIGAHLAAAPWLATGEADLGLIRIPESVEPIVLEWQSYRHPSTFDADSNQYAGTFSLGSARFWVKEWYEYIWVDERGILRRRFQGAGDCAGCTEIVRVLASGGTLVPERIERGAYKGMWRCDVFAAREHPQPGVMLERTACRAIFNLARSRIQLFRRCCLERAPLVA